jgi:hypothetical protein
VFCGDLVSLLCGAAFRFLSRCFEIGIEINVVHTIRHHGHVVWNGGDGKLWLFVAVQSQILIFLIKKCNFRLINNVAVGLKLHILCVLIV